MYIRARVLVVGKSRCSSRSVVSHGRVSRRPHSTCRPFHRHRCWVIDPNRQIRSRIIVAPLSRASFTLLRERRKISISSSLAQTLLYIYIYIFIYIHACWKIGTFRFLESCASRCENLRVVSIDDNIKR